MYTALTSLKDPEWVDKQQTASNCWITTAQLGDEILLFTASPTDVESHGRAIFADIVAGKYGPIAEYQP